MDGKIKLRKWNWNDLDSLVKHANNFNIARFLTDQFPYPYTYEDARSFISSVLNDEPDKCFAIDLEGEAIGSIGIFPQSDIHSKNAEIGYWLSEQYWGRGIMFYAVKEITKYGFATFDITRIFARPFSINPASQRVLEKAGFKLEARFGKALFKHGQYFDELIYSIRK